MNEPSITRTPFLLVALGLSVALGSACSGRSIDGRSSLGGTSGGPAAAGGAPSGEAGNSTVAGTANAGTANAGTANAGTANAGTANAGTANAGAGNDCGHAICPAVACGEGGTLVIPIGACCPVCQSPCHDVICPPLNCPEGYQIGTQGLTCCPSCIPIPVVNCATGQASYEELRSQLATKYASGCKSAADCATVAPTNLCESGCRYVAIASNSLGNLNTNLANSAQTACAGCEQSDLPPCDPPMPPICNDGTCTLGN